MSSFEENAFPIIASIGSNHNSSYLQQRHASNCLLGRRSAHKQTWKRVLFRTDELIIFKLTVSHIKTGVTVVRRVGRWSVQLGSGLRACPAHRLHI